jgi:acetoacetyl-CoA synthetase
LSAAHTGDILWEPSIERAESTNLTRYIRWLAANGFGTFADYPALWAWSVRELDRFWESIWRFHDVSAARPYRVVREGSQMPGTSWFPGSRLNYAEHLFRNAVADQIALLWRSEDSQRSVSWAELRDETAALAAGLRELGVRPGDRVVAVMPNLPETLTAFLAVTSIGAVWSVCSPDFGLASLVDRFRQIEPVVLLAVDGYRHGGKTFDRRSLVSELQKALPSLRHTVLLPYLDRDVSTAGFACKPILWRDLVAGDHDLEFTHVEADHPLWIVYTSGTTGLPKPIVHGHAGVLLERLKAVVLHGDVKPDDRYFWYTTTGWVMWNLNVSALLGCATIVLYDGSPWFPDRAALWHTVEETRTTIFGTSSAYLVECMREGQVPRDRHDLSALRAMGATASPLPAEAFAWVYGDVKKDVWLASSSGGTDVATAFVGGCPLLPVYAGEIQCRELGIDVQAFDEQGHERVDEVGELVVLQPMPSMPLYFWNDEGNRRYHDSYFAKYPGVWCHGDWISFTPRGSAVIHGRSDSTINRNGVRVGTSEIYRAVDTVSGVADSLVIELPVSGRDATVVLFVVLQTGVRMDVRLEAAITDAVRVLVSPRHVPDVIEVIAEVPRTLNGKKLEVPVKRILSGVSVHDAVTIGSVANPQSLQHFVHWRNAR